MFCVMSIVTLSTRIENPFHFNILGGAKLMVGTDSDIVERREGSAADRAGEGIAGGLL